MEIITVGVASLQRKIPREQIETLKLKIINIIFKVNGLQNSAYKCFQDTFVNR